MNEHSDFVLFAVNLAVNLFLFGCFIAGSVAISFRLLKNSLPRWRYLTAVTAFLIAAFLPLAVTLNGSIRLDTFIEAKNSASGANSFGDNFVNQIPAITPEFISAPNRESGKMAIGLLNDFTSRVADSLFGTIFFSLWIFGSVCFFSRDILAYQRLRKARRGWRPATYSERKELGFPGGTALYFGEESPATVGFFYPVIVLPKRFSDDLSPASKSFIMEHELAHARGRDPLVNSFLRLIRSLFWISPALWLLQRIAATEREAAADYAAIARCSANKSEFETTALNYATTLISVARHFSSSAPHRSFKPDTIGLSSGTASILESRIRRILAQPSKTDSLRISLASMIFVSSMIGLFFIPVAFQPKQLKTALHNNLEPAENLTGKENQSDLPVANPQNNLPQIIGSNKTKEKNTKGIISNQDRNVPEKFSNELKAAAETPQTAAQIPKRIENLNDAADDGASEDLMRKLGEADAKASGIQQKMDELSGKLQSLEDSRKNLGSNIIQMRQKEASRIDSMMRQTQRGY